MRTLALASILALAAALAPLAASAETVALLPATGANVHAGHLAAATDVLRAHLERTGRFAVVLAPGPASDQEPTPAQAAEAARSAGAALAVTVRLSRLGATALVRLAAFRPDGAVARVDELGAAGPEDLDPVLRRLAEGLATGRPARELAEIDSVTLKESDPYLKYMATNVIGVRLGSAFPVNRLSGGAGAAGGGGVFWLYDARTYLAELTLDVFQGDRDSLVQLGIGAYWPLTRGNVSPYLGGGLAYTWAHEDVATGAGGTIGASSSGLSFRAGGGLLVGRLSTVQLRLDAAWSVNAFASRDPVSGRTRVGQGPVLTVGIGF